MFEEERLHIRPRFTRYSGMDTVEITPEDLLHELDEFLTAVPYRTNYSEVERHELMNLLLDLRGRLIAAP